jgi:uncharacterized protein (TIGR03067 family)
MTRQTFALTAVVGVTLVAGVLANQQQGQDVLLGEWRLVGGSYRGQSFPQSQSPPVVLRVEKDGRWSDTEGMAATWSTDETKKPKTLDLDYTAGRDRGKRQLCVFEVAGDRLTIACGASGGEETDRPSGFLTTPDNAKVFVLTFERIKNVTRGCLARHAADRSACITSAAAADAYR